MRSRLLATAILLCEAGSALASEEAHGSHTQPHGIPWLTLFFTAVNFTLFVLLLSRRFARPSHLGDHAT